MHIYDVLTVAAPQAFRGEHSPIDMNFPRVCTEVERNEIIGMMFPEMHESAMWNIQFDEKYTDSVFDYLVSCAFSNSEMP